MTKAVIGLSPRILRQVPPELGFRDKTLQYLEQSMAHCVMRLGGIVVMIPTVEHASSLHRWEVATEDYVAALDGLILQGGADIDPDVYGEDPTHIIGPTDPVRDRFELELLRGFVAAGKPVLGICRGMQLINVAYGGSLHQDLEAAGVAQLKHRILPLYDEHTHEVTFTSGGWLETIYQGMSRAEVTSIHHQGVHVLGDGLIVDATSPDGVTEAIRHRDHEFVVGVQWHPEFHDSGAQSLLPTEPLVKAFIRAAVTRKSDPVRR